MVEEMMLLANCTVAERILGAFPSCALLRRHAVPPPRQFEPLLRAAAACSLDLDVSSSKVRAAEPLNAGVMMCECTPVCSEALYWYEVPRISLAWQCSAHYACCCQA